MPYVITWEDFARAAERLYLNDPGRTRLCLAYKHREGRFVVKVTDDRECVMYRTDQAQDLKRLEKFNSSLMRHMASKD